MIENLMVLLKSNNRTPLICLLFLSITTLACLSFEEKVNPPIIEVKPIEIPQKKVAIQGANFINAPIILPKACTPFMVEAAKELANYIEKICGRKPAILEGVPSLIPPKAIWVGFQPAINKLFPTVDFTYKYPEEIINTANENYIALTGRDIWDPKNMSVPNRTGEKMVTGIQQEYGTCNAVYTFIQDQLNIRWLWPGPFGEDVIQSKELVVPSFLYQYHPQIRDRSGILYNTRVTSNKGSKEEHRWVRLQRMQLSSLVLHPSHAFKDWWARYSKSNPEFFALLADGTRIPKFNTRDVKICQSNPKVWDQWLVEVEEQLKLNPNQNVFAAGTNDGWTFGHCTCENCKAWGVPGSLGPKPNLADRDVMFANALAKKLVAKYPGKEYFVNILGYGYSRPAPLKAIPDKNVIVMSVTNFLQRGDGVDDERTLAMKQYSDWGKITKNLSWRPNIGNPAGKSVGMPDIAPHQAAQDFKFVAQNGCIGLFFDTYWSHWATQCIQYYAMAQLAWNPSLNIDSLLDDYYLRAYGPAANEMKAFWTLMEDTRNDFVDKVKTKGRFAVATKFYTDAWFSTAEKLLEGAKKKVENGDLKYKERFNYTMGGFSYVKLLMDTRKKVEIFESESSNPNIKKEIDANWLKAKEMKSKLQPLSINFNVVFNKTDKMQGYHYNAPLGKRAKKQLADAEGYE